MEFNTCILYTGTTEAYAKLLLFCAANGFKVKENAEKFYSIEATKSFLLFWRNMRIKLEILAVEKTQVSVTAQVYKFHIRQPKLEHQYITKVKNYFDFGE